MSTAKQRRRMKKAVEHLQKYMMTYSNQAGYLNYSDETLIDDVLYGLGVALNERYRYRDGFDLFRQRLFEHIKREEDKQCQR